MKTYLEFHDTTSNKFWQIEVNDIQHTVTYGKTNTDGQSKSKTFETAELCLKDAEKLIKSKKAKGYAELGETAVIPEKKSRTTSSADSSLEKSNKQAALDALDQLIRTGKIEDVIAFIQQYAEGNSTALKKALSQAKRYWCDYQDLSKDPEFIDRNRPYSNWGRRGKERHQDIIHLLAFALMNASDPKSTWSLSQYIYQYDKNPIYTEVLKTFKPDWLGGYLKERIISDDWSVEYHLLRQLENDGLIQFDPQLFGLAVPKFQHYDHKQNRITAKSTIASYLNDDLLIQRDLPLMFEYETRPQDQWFGNWNNPIHPWHNIFVDLVKLEKIDRGFIIQKIMEMQSKNWNIQTKSFFKKILAELEVTETELLQQQDQLFLLLHSEFSATVTFSFDYIKQIYQHPEFKLAEYLSWLEPLMMRTDLKNIVKNILIQLPHILKQHQDDATQELCLGLIADALMQSTLDLQERAAKLLLKHLKPEQHSIIDKIQMYQDNLIADIKTSLAAYLNPEATEHLDELDTAQSTYQYQSASVQQLNPNNKVELPTTWHDLLFFMGQMTQSTQPLDIDIFMSAWLLLRDQRPLDADTQLQPILNQMQNWNWSAASYSTVFNFNFSEYYTKHIDSHQTQHARNLSYRDHIFYTWSALILEFLNSDLKQHQLPLLSLPTHAPSFIDPEILVQRLLDYQHADTKIKLTDLSVAISRMSQENREAALALSTQIQDEQLQTLIQVALKALPLDPVLAPPEFITQLSNLEYEEWRGVWATMALTHYPYITLTRDNNIEHVTLHDQPHDFTYIFSDHKEHIWHEDKKQYIREVVGQYIRFELPTYQKTIATDLYRQQCYSQYNKDSYYLDYSITAADLVFVRHLSPINQIWNDLKFAADACYNPDFFSAHNSVLFLAMMEEHYDFNAYSHFILASHLFAAKKDGQAFAIECTAQKIFQQQLNLEIFAQHCQQMIQHNFAPFSRFVDSLIAVSEYSALHKHALLQFFEVLLPKLTFTEKLPTQFKKFIELYYLVKQQSSVPVPVQQQLLAWQELSNSLKPLVKKILNGAL